MTKDGELAEANKSGELRILNLWTFAPKSSLVQIFSKLLLSLDYDQLMSEKQKKLGAHRAFFGNKACWKCCVFRSLVMKGEIGFLATRIKISYVEDSRQCLFNYSIANRPI